MEYRTVGGLGSDSFIEKKSRFIGHCRPVSSPEEAQEFIAGIKKEHWDANHNVSAYILRDGNMRYSDDGEPQGTAGVPVLEVLKKSGITDAVVVVTRYFGGILLGAGGLVRAYSHGASIALQAAGPVVMQECRVLCARCEYKRYTKLQELVARHGGIEEDTVFDDSVHLTFHLLPENLAPFEGDFADLTNGRGIIQQLENKFFGFSPKK